MLNETLEGLQIKPDGVYVDVTFGGGGHSRAILERLGGGGRLLGFDQDLDAAQNALDDARFTFVRSNFRYLSNFLRYHNIEKVDGILADLGVSSHHFDDETRGFSFRFDGDLDMRMNRRAALTAADVLNSYDEAQLSDIFFNYGELRQARRIARGGGARCGSDNDGSAVDRCGEAVFPARTREKRDGQTVSGVAHRGERRDGRIARIALPVGTNARCWRSVGGAYLPFARGQNGEKFCQNGQCRRTSGEGFLWQSAFAVCRS